jgi:hypothetical protein
MRNALIWLLTTIVLSACGAAPASHSPTPAASGDISTRPTGGGALAFAATVTEKDTGRTLRARTGDRVQIALRATSGYADWQLQPLDGTVLRPAVNPAAAAARGVTLAAAIASAPGTTSIDATSRPQCQVAPQPGVMCAQNLVALQVRVVVN